jgi:hypothetical protein
MRLSFHALALFLLGCTGDDVTYDPPDGGNKDGSSDATIKPPSDGSTDALDATSDAPPRLLLTQVAGMGGELAAFNVQTGMVDGRFTYVGFGTTQGSSAGPFLLETGVDIVVRLDRDQPWIARSTWSVAMNDAFDGGENYANPVQVIVTAPNKAYVLRYNRNRIAVIDPTQAVEAGAPTTSVDVSSLLQTQDKDGHVDMSGAVYDPVRKRLYVALANIDLGNVDPMGYFLLCKQPANSSTLVAIDTTNDTLVNLGGAGLGGGVVLNGISPQYAGLGGVVFDAAGDRVLVMSTGCNDPGDGGPGALHGRLIEAVSLSTNTTMMLLDATAQDFPGQLVFVDPTHAIVSFGFGSFGKTFLWDPSTTTLGPAFDVSPELFDYDRKGAILGPRTVTVDGGKTVQVLSVFTSAPDAGSKVLGTDPFTKKGDYFGNAVVWP